MDTSITNKRNVHLKENNSITNEKKTRQNFNTLMRSWFNNRIGIHNPNKKTVEKRIRDDISLHRSFVNFPLNIQSAKFPTLSREQTHAGEESKI